MKKMLVALCASMMLMTTATYAAKAPPSEKQLAQRQRMKDCNAEAKTKAMVGADRKAFMKTCLSGNEVTAEPASAKPAAAAPATPAAAAPAAPAVAPAVAAAKPANQKEKMKACNADAKTKALKGADRKAFMSTCLKG